ncbi:alpha/beta fold hydrolase [Virgibacillus sp. SK37]|uniref:alpha/beta fold hydrolase n=1 Tax=Virgibacillus sp. SK37 TaxID=403957 RepID=UPI0004D18AA8|nr:alpha/beta fold hydrolase [Virgibacillus sp. SK37]AIF45304.1 hypothetical protein X953_06840 [Virgibacillus sp. SK37]
MKANFAAINKRKGLIEKEWCKTYFEIHTSDSQVNDSTPIILLAGGPGLSFTTLTPLLRLARTRTVVVYDQLGSGKSTRSDQLSSLSISDFIEQFNDVITELGIKNFHILGHSWGAILAVNVALQFPKNVQSLILHSGIADWKDCLKHRKKFESDFFPKNLKETIYKLKQNEKISSEEIESANILFNQLFYCRTTYPIYLDKALEDKDSGTNQLIWNTDKNEEMANYNICPRLKEIKCPTLIISGKYDGISVGQGELFNSLIQNSKHIVFNNSSHYAHIEEEQEFIRQVSNFLNTSS